MARDFFDELSDTITRTTKDLGKKAGQLYEAQKIRSKHPKTRIVFLTDHDELHARDCGMPADFCAPAYPDAKQITRLIENLFVKETAAN